MNRGTIRKAALLLAVVLPRPLKIFFYRKVMGWTIGERVSIGLSYIDSQWVSIGDDTRIMNFTVVRNIKRFQVGRGTFIGNFNEMYGHSLPFERFLSHLTIGDRVHLMSHHFFDVGGVVEVGDDVVIAGRETQLWSHSLLMVEGKQSLEPTTVRVGNFAYVGARSTLLGCDIPPGAFVAAGSVVAKSFPPEDCRLLIAGNPAQIKKRYDAAVPTGPPMNVADRVASPSISIDGA